MANVLRLKRRAAGGASGAPSALASAEPAYNEQDDVLYYGKGNSSGAATSVVPIGGKGAFVDLSSPQTINGAKSFSTRPDFNGNTPLDTGNVGTAIPTGVITPSKLTQSAIFANLCVNGDFEEGTVGWTAFVNGAGANFTVPAASPGNSYSGSRYGLLDRGTTTAGSAYSYIGQNNFMPVEPSTIYDVRAFIKGSTASAAGFYIIIYWFKGDGTASTVAATLGIPGSTLGVGYTNVYNDAPIPSVYTNKGGYINSPSDARFAQIYILNHTNSTCQQLSVDAILFRRDPTDASAVSLVTANIPAPFSYGGSILPRLAKDCLDDFVSFKRFRRATDADDGVTINYALSQHPAIYVPPGDYLSSVTLNFRGVPQSLKGDGWGTARIRQTTTTLQLVNFPDYADHATLQGLSLGRTVGAVAGGSGVVFAGRSSFCVLRDLSVEDHFRNIHLSTTDWGILENIVARRAYEDGLTIVPYQDINGGACQWQLRGVLSEFNAGNGFRAQGVTGTNGMILGEWSHISTFANTQNGILLAGLSGTGTNKCTINDFRLSEFFLGSDAIAGLNIDAQGGLKNRIHTGSVELAGEDLTGRAYTTAKSHAAYGIIVTASNKDLMIGNTHVTDCSYTGIYANHTGLLKLTDVTVHDCGVAGTSGATYGVHNAGTGKLMAINLQSGNDTRTTQTFGLVAADGAKSKVTGGDLTGNTTGRSFYSANSGSAVEATIF